MRKWKLFLVAIVVAAGIVGGIDYFSEGGLAWQSAPPARPGHMQGMMPVSPGEGVYTVKPLPPPVGAPDAKVRLQAFVASGNPCHDSTIATLRAAAEALPKHIRLEFVDTLTGEGQKAAAAADIHCMSGLLVNSKLNLEYKDKDGKTSQVVLSKPLDMHSADVLPSVLAHELRSQYAGAVSQTEIDGLFAAVTKAASTSGAAHGH